MEGKEGKGGWKVEGMEGRKEGEGRGG